MERKENGENGNPPDNTYATAKRVSNAMGGGRMGGFRGNGEKKENINNSQ